MRRLFKSFFFGIVLGFLPIASFAQDVHAQQILRIVDFEDAETSQNTGVWLHNILDSEQGLKMEISQEKDGSKKILRLDYDVDSPNPAMVGFWVNLRKI